MKEIIESLPFSEETKIIIAVVLLVIIVLGIVFKKHIVNLIKKYETK